MRRPNWIELNWNDKVSSSKTSTSHFCRCVCVCERASVCQPNYMCDLDEYMNYICTSWHNHNRKHRERIYKYYTSMYEILAVAAAQALHFSCCFNYYWAQLSLDKPRVRDEMLRFTDCIIWMRVRVCTYALYTIAIIWFIRPWIPELHSF